MLNRNASGRPTGGRHHRPQRAHSNSSLLGSRMKGRKDLFIRKPAKGSFVVTWEGRFLPASCYDPAWKDILVEAA